MEPANFLLRPPYLPCLLPSLPAMTCCILLEQHTKISPCSSKLLLSSGTQTSHSDRRQTTAPSNSETTDYKKLSDLSSKGDKTRCAYSHRQSGVSNCIPRNRGPRSSWQFPSSHYFSLWPTRYTYTYFTENSQNTLYPYYTWHVLRISTLACFPFLNVVMTHCLAFTALIDKHTQVEILPETMFSCASSCVDTTECSLWHSLSEKKFNNELKGKTKAISNWERHAEDMFVGNRIKELWVCTVKMHYIHIWNCQGINKK